MYVGKPLSTSQIEDWWINESGIAADISGTDPEAPRGARARNEKRQHWKATAAAVAEQVDSVH